MMVKMIARQRQRTLLTNSRSRALSLAMIICACCFASCTAPTAKRKMIEAPPPSAASQVTDQPQQSTAMPPPDLHKAQDAVKRVFKEAVVIDTTRKPSFIVGDFNGDQSQDIAVVLKPAAGKLDELNEEYPNWMLKDPFRPNQPGAPRLRIAEDEVLLAVIHGYGPNGWTDSEATQTFLLKDVVGSGMQMHPGKEFMAANHGKKLPLINGDLIGEVLKGTSGYLYYGNAAYAWYDPKTFKDEPRPKMMVHSGGAKSSK